MKTVLRANLALAVAFLLLSTGWGAEFKVTSPNGRVEMTVDVGQSVRWSASFDQKPVLVSNRIELMINGTPFPPTSPLVVSSSQKSIHEPVTPVIAATASSLDNDCNELTLEFEQAFRMQFRAYDLGIAYRCMTGLQGAVSVGDETAEFRFADSCKTFFPKEEALVSHYERLYEVRELSEIAEGEFCSLPVLLKTKPGVYVAITDADLYDYPAMFLSGTAGNALTSTYPRVVLATRPDPKSPDRNEQIAHEADSIAKTTGQRSFPWRVVMLADRPGALIEDDLVFKLSRPLILKETSWIKPGKVAWDWWNANNVIGVDFPAGINTETYKFYIDFAAEYGLEYIILDEGWSKTTTNLLEMKSDVDVEALVRYGNSKDVGVILWTLWKPLDQNMQRVLDTWANWGVRGIKVDFMARADQDMVNFYERTAREAARRKMIVDFHGAFKPAGLRRAFPNVLNYEGVKGLENCKWCADITPQHDVTLPFTRMLAGPMDFTPGAMVNVHKANFAARFTQPMSLGTRCHQVAMYVIFSSPLQMLCDSPSNYRADPNCTEFISQMPTTWDETKVLAGEVGEYIVMARRSKDSWYLGAMTNWQKRDLVVDLAFLPNGEWHLASIADGINAHRHASDYRLAETKVDRRQKLMLRLAPGGGWAGQFRPQ